jgi:hypothetical protein
MSNYQPPQDWDRSHTTPPQQGWTAPPGPAGPPGGTPGAPFRGAPAPPPEPSRKSRTPILLAAAGVAVVAVVAVVLVGSGDDSDGSPASDGRSITEGSEQEPGGSSRPEDDVRITSCELDPSLKWPSAELTVTNRSGDRSNYLVSVEFVDAQGIRINEGYAAANNLLPKQSAEVKAQGMSAAEGEITCKVNKVTRYAS